MDAQARELRFLRRTPTGSVKEPSCTRRRRATTERSWPSPWAVYGECVETHRVSIRDCGEAAPYAVLLFGGRVEPRPLQGSIVVDGWVSFAAHARVGALVAALREHFDAAPGRQGRAAGSSASNRARRSCRLLVSNSSGRSCGCCCTTGRRDFSQTLVV